MTHSDLVPSKVAVDDAQDGTENVMRNVQVPLLARRCSKSDVEPPPQAPADEGGGTDRGQAYDDRGGDGTEDLLGEECTHGRVGGHDEVPQDIEDGDPVHAHSGDAHVQASHDGRRWRFRNHGGLP